MVANAKYTTADLLHYLRNPSGLSATEVRRVRIEAADEIEHLMKMLRGRAAQETGTAPTWRCGICSLLNPDDATHCRQCEYSRMVLRDGKQVPRDRQR